eukprot:7960373-Alexandrium_andersonii.AAC.1
MQRTQPEATSEAAAWWATTQGAQCIRTRDTWPNLQGMQHVRCQTRQRRRLHGQGRMTHGKFRKTCN